jgi:ABC-type multidrug transport system fused ATPase/permease subunit
MNTPLVRGLLWEQRGRLALLGGCLLAMTAFQLAMPQVLRVFIDSALAQAAVSTLTGLAGLYALFAGGQFLLTMLRVYLKEDIAWRATNKLRESLTRHVLSLDLPFHQKNPPGALIERVDGDVNTLNNIVSDLALVIGTNLLLMGGVLVILVIQEPRIGIPFIVFTVVIGAVLWRLRAVAKDDFEDYRQKESDQWGFIEERISGAEDIRANGGAAYTLTRLLWVMRDYARAGISAYYKVILLRQVSFALFASGSILAIILSAELFRRGEATIGTVFMTYTYARLLAEPIEQITLKVQDLQTAIASVGRIGTLLDERPSIVERPSSRATVNGDQISVEFENVTFAYTADEPVLRDFSLHVEAGQVLGVMGRTGSGKSTLARLLLRLYDVQEGSVRIGGVDVRDLSFTGLRNTVAIVSQEVTLFHASLRGNLTLFDETVADERLMHAIDGLALRDWFERQANGLDTIITPSELSAGEAQLIAFARAFLRDPRVVVLDEAASRLDPQTEAAIDGAITRLLEGRTGIIIAHRLASVERADAVLVMRDGQVAEHGQRAALAEDPDSLYRHLLNAGQMEAA